MIYKFPWGSFIYARTFNSLASCLVGRDDKFKEGVDAPAKRKVERYNVYGFLTAFQVWGIETIPKWAIVRYAVRVNNVTPRILNWRCTETPANADILKNIFKFKNLTIYKVLGPSNDESKKPYWAGMDQLQYVSPDVDGCVVEDDVEEDVLEDVQDDIDQTTSMKNSLMDEMRMGLLRLTELVCLNKVAEKLNEHNNTDFSQNDTFQDYQPSIPHGLKSPEFVVVSETSEDVKQLTRPPKLTIKVPRDRKRSAFTVSSYIDPTAKRPRKMKNVRIRN
ncbi:hypothetical protein Dsin_000614 [Dipteronia sinensis]|uniref:Uncharacterized protein n=1 Tax=Dipteronia sinensis TaxID=43782 RepID=A0AAE0B2D2_9ROSI|nr:hypothetical protein Dsin_000614 [Dipteronia sinensis]